VADLLTVEVLLCDGGREGEGAGDEESRKAHPGRHALRMKEEGRPQLSSAELCCLFAC